MGVIMNVYTRFEDENWANITDFTDEVYELFINLARKGTYKKYDGVVDMVGVKNRVESIDINEFKKIIASKIKTSELFKLIKDRKSETAQSQTLSSILDAVNYDFDELMDNEGDVLVENYLNSLDDYSMVASDIGIIQKDMLNVANGDVMNYVDLLIKLNNFIDNLDWSRIQNGVKDTMDAVLLDFTKSWYINNKDNIMNAVMEGAGADTMIELTNIIKAKQN
jgi:hypothetical protein